MPIGFERPDTHDTSVLPPDENSHRAVSGQGLHPRSTHERIAQANISRAQALPSGDDVGGEQVAIGELELHSGAERTAAPSPRAAWQHTLRRSAVRMVRPLIARNGEIMSVTTTASMAALTFDDGPHPYWTPRYLRLLAAFNMRATFFVLGEKAERHPELIGAIADAGHAIGLHGWDHAALAEADGDGDLVKFNALLDRSLEALGSVHCKLFRPPFGQASRDIRRAVRGHGLEMVGWSVSAWDWQDRSAVDMADKVTARLRRGSIVLLHDDLADPAEPRFVDRAQSLDALGLILARRDDLQFVTVPELLGAGTPHRARPKRNVAGR